MKLQIFSGRILLAVAGAVLFIMTTGSGAVAAGPDMTIKGSTTVLPIAQIAAETFMDEHPGINISVQGGGSGVGIASLIDGTTDIADSSRKIKDKEIDKAKAAGINPFENIIAMDGIAVIVHPSNPLSKLGRDQIKDIYTGKVSNWSDLGGKGGKIIVISRDSSSGTFEAFEELAINKEKVRADALTTASNQAVAQTVAQTPGAIGYIGLGYLSGKVKDIEVDSVKCTKETVISGKYSLSRPLFMYTNGAPAGNVKKFIDFVLSDEVQKMVEEEGFVGLK
ncbi:MAG TPA: PstS family phosphate ABC transporter substrate-binding protein [Deltaproteobacteria bacterium]|nr:PstS family phosphate ABC transporter substrate-binding protein [Deltaproteobacteria bacterium]